MMYVCWVLFIIGFFIVGTVPVESMASNLGMIIMLVFGIFAIIETVKYFKKPKEVIRVVEQQQQQTKGVDGFMNRINDNTTSKLGFKRDMKRDSMVYKTVRLVLILGALFGLALLGIEKIKALALVLAIILGTVIVLFLGIGLPLLLIFKDTVKAFINRKASHND